VAAAHVAATYLFVPDTTRLQLRIIALKNDRLVEAGGCVLLASMTGAIQSISPHEVSVVTLNGLQTAGPGNCLKPSFEPDKKQG